MKRLLLILGGIVLIIIIGTVLVLFYPQFNKRHNIEQYSLSFTAPNYYEEVSDEAEIYEYRGTKNGIGISIYKFNKSFLGGPDITEKLVNYKGILAASNYDCVLEDDHSNVVEVSKTICGKFSSKIKSVNQLNKEVTLIIPKEEYDLIFTICGIDEQMSKHNKEVEKILNSIRFK